MKFQLLSTLLMLPAMAAAGSIPLSSLELDLMTAGYGRPVANRAIEGTPLRIAGRTFTSGVATHAASDFFIRLDGRASRFRAVCGIDDDSRQTAASVRFHVLTDGKPAWSSPLMKGGMPGVPVDLPLQGVAMLQLRVDDGGDGIKSDHADWADAVIDYQGEPPAACAPPPPPARWQLGGDNSTIWKIGGSRLPHADFIEQGGRRAGQKVWYEIEADQTLKLERDVVWPSLRIIPNDTHGSLIKHYGREAEPRISVDGKPLGPIRISTVVLDGTLTFHGEAGNLAVERITFPAFGKYAAIDRWLLTNKGSRPAGIAVAPLALTAETPGPYGLNRMEVVCDAPPAATLPPGGTLAFSIQFTARQDDMPQVAIDGAVETALRRDFIDRLTRSLRLETPDPVLNRAFTFAKWRVAEAINDTRGGMMLAPGNLRYYAASWCNDNVEYAGPFFPFLGEAGGIEGSLNVYRQYLAHMKPSFKPIPSSIIAEGTGTWSGAGDRGDAAMYAFGASRFALALGDPAVARELWKGINWSLEYCKRRQTADGVIASDTDELEGRLPAGKANLTTSSLYYGGLRSAAHLGRAIGETAAADDFDHRADAMAGAIEGYFGATVGGFDSYRYYAGNSKLRAWICMPLSMGIFDRRRATIDALFSPAMWTADGLATQAGDRVFWDRSTLYALGAVFKAGETERALEFLSRYTCRRLLGEHVPYAVEAYPEGGQGHLASESGLYCRIYLEGLFGILPTGLDRFQCVPRLPAGWPSMALRSIRAFGREFDLVVTRAGSQNRIRVLEHDLPLVDQTVAPGAAIEVVLPPPSNP